MGGAVQDRADDETGIDLFDFLYELWKSKWLFLGVLVLFLVLGSLSLLPQLRAPSTPQPGAAGAKIEFTLDLPNDPMQREPPQLIGDILKRLTKDGSLRLSNAETAAIGVTLTDRTYRVTYSPGANIGVLTINAAGSEPGYFERVYAAFQGACAEQVADLKRQQEDDLAIIAQIVRNEYSGESNTLANRIFLARRFLARPDVQAGTFCLVRPTQLETIAHVAERGSRGIARRILLAALVGAVAGVLLVMFRIAIARKRNTAASA
jgi:hypothetical protein